MLPFYEDHKNDIVHNKLGKNDRKQCHQNKNC